MIKYIASDLDGTLLKSGAQCPDPAILEMILQLKEKGIRFIAASGRQYQNMYRMFRPIQDDISYIAENGSLCIHNHQVISRGVIERSLALRIFDAAKKFPGCDYMVSCENIMYTDSKNETFIHHLRHEIGYDVQLVDDLKQITDPYLKFAICDFQGSERILSHFQKLFRSEIKVVTSGNIWIDFIAPNANKGSALSGLCRHFGFSAKDGIAFGDQQNDVEMLETAGISYAMIPCAPGVEKHAKRRTDSVERVLSEILQNCGVPELSNIPK